MSTDKILAVLAPPEELSELETGAVLRYVRRGGSLLTVIARGSAMGDSLHLKPATSVTTLPVMLIQKPVCTGKEPRSVYQMIGDQGFAIPFSQPTRIPAGSTGFVSSRDPYDPKLTRLSAIGFPYGKGRIVALSDRNLLRNDYIRICAWGVGESSVRMLEYLSAGRTPRQTRLVFDEFHQGFGPKPNIPHAIATVLFHTSPGAMLFQIIVASGILLLAIAPRAILPPATSRVQRRSPFEHVEALSSAYSQIGATRVVTERLVRGLRRRLSSGSGPTGARVSDGAFLESVSLTHPGVSTEVATITNALTRQSSPAQLVAVGEAIETIERTIKR